MPEAPLAELGYKRHIGGASTLERADCQGTFEAGSARLSKCPRPTSPLSAS